MACTQHKKTSAGLRTKNLQAMVLEKHDGSCDCSTNKKIVVAGVFGFSKEQMFLD